MRLMAALLIGSMACYAQANEVLYEGARLIVGDGSAPIENGAFLVREGALLLLDPRVPSKRPREPVRLI